MTLTESTKIRYISDRLAGTAKLNIKEILLETMVFLKMFRQSMNCSQRLKDISRDEFFIQ